MYISDGENRTLFRDGTLHGITIRVETLLKMVYHTMRSIFETMWAGHYPR